MYVCTISQSDLVGNCANFPNVRMEIAFDANISNVEYGRENGAHLLKILHTHNHRISHYLKQRESSNLQLRKWTSYYLLMPYSYMA